MAVLFLWSLRSFCRDRPVGKVEGRVCRVQKQTDWLQKGPALGVEVCTNTGLEEVRTGKASGSTHPREQGVSTGSVPAQDASSQGLSRF